MPVWKELLKLGKPARGGDDAVSAMFDEIIKVRPDLKGALNYIKSEYKIGNLSGEAAKRAANMAERSAGARGASVSDRTGVKILGDYGTSRTSAREAMDNPAFEAIDERIRDFDLKGNEMVNAVERNARAKEARAADVIDDDYQTWDKQAYEDFDKAIKERFNKLDDTAHENYIHSGMEDAIVQRFDNAKKAGEDTRTAIDEVTEYMRKKYGNDEYDFGAVIEEELKRAGRL